MHVVHLSTVGWHYRRLRLYSSYRLIILGRVNGLMLLLRLVALLVFSDSAYCEFRIIVLVTEQINK